MNSVHTQLLRYQTTKELERKAKKAVSKSNLWSQEEIDLGRRVGAITGKILGWDYDKNNLYIKEEV